jgi:phage terminase large subunit-like protein
VTDPYIPLLAYTEEQSDELAYGALRVILENSAIADEFDIGLERIMRVKGDGKAESVASVADARDGARASFSLVDESHRFKRNSRAKGAHKVMLANLAKRAAADAWGLEITTAPAPGEGSVAEDVHDFAKQVAAGKLAAPTFFFFHREAGPEHVIRREDGSLDPVALRNAIVDASGSAAAWSDIDKIADQFTLPGADVSYLERVWLNRLVQAAEAAFDLTLWAACAQPEATIPAGALVTLGFDGARRDDSTALVATEVETGLQELLGLWERPLGRAGDNWAVDEGDVSAAVDAAFERFNVWRFYADPPYWESTVAQWSGSYGADVVIAWSTYRYNKMAHAVRGYANAMKEREIHHTGDPRLARHIGNAHRQDVQIRDEKGARMWVICKARPDSPEKIDAAMASILSWQARLDAVALGLAKPAPAPQSMAVEWLDV